MSAKHTPGPWNAVEHHSDQVSVIDPNGFEIVSAASVAILLGYSEKLGITHWADDERASRELSPEEQAANARLIAAAPDLFELAQEVVRVLESDGPAISDTVWVTDGRPETLLDMARAAIAKATGEQP